MSDHRTMKPPSLWLPEPNVATLLALGKLAEEAAELAKICARSVIQGINGNDPDDGRPNWNRLMEEIADVRGLSKLIIDEEGLDETFIQERADAKYEHKLQWITEAAAATDPAPASPPSARKGV